MMDFFAEVYVEAPAAQEISNDEAGTGSEDEESDYEDEMDVDSEDEAGMEDEEEALPQDADLGSGARHIVPYNPRSHCTQSNKNSFGQCLSWSWCCCQSW
jgi:alpha-galactosidase